MSDNIIDTIAEALDSVPADLRPSALVNRDRAAKVVAALRGKYAIIQLPAPNSNVPAGATAAWDIHRGSQVTAWNDGTITVNAINFGNAANARLHGAALFAAADAAEREKRETTPIQCRRCKTRQATRGTDHLCADCLNEFEAWMKAQNDAGEGK